MCVCGGVAGAGAASSVQGSTCRLVVAVQRLHQLCLVLDVALLREAQATHSRRWRQLATGSWGRPQRFLNVVAGRGLGKSAAPTGARGYGVTDRRSRALPRENHARPFSGSLQAAATPEVATVGIFSKASTVSRTDAAAAAERRRAGGHGRRSPRPSARQGPMDQRGRGGCEGGRRAHLDGLVELLESGLHKCMFQDGCRQSRDAQCFPPGHARATNPCSSTPCHPNPRGILW